MESVSRTLVHLKAEEEKLRKLIRDHVDQNPHLSEQHALLTSIPGVGDQVSSHFMAWLRPERFDDARQAVAFVGLSPRHRQSGDSVRGKARLCKVGHARLRKILYFPAMSAMRYNPAAKAIAERLKASGKTGKVVIGAVMRKMIHWMFGVLKSGRPFDPKLALAK